MPAVKDMALVEKSETAMVPAKPTEAQEFMEAFERLAVNPDVDVAKLSALLDLRDRILNRDAEQAFARDFALMQGELPTIAESASANNWKYAALEDIVDKVRPVLSRHGFSLSHHTEWPAGKQVVIGTLTHKGGHSRTSRFESEPDKTGSKNSIQALGSVTMYGRRYTACELLGIVTRKEDNDGTGALPEAPAGFIEWRDGLRSAAMLGHAALDSAWKATAPEGCKAYLTVLHRKEWESLKRTASEVDRA